MRIRLALLMLLIIALPFASAEESAGVTPDSFLYGLDRAMDRIGYALSLGKASKTEKGLRIAEERLMEARQMAEEGRFAHAERARQEHARSLELAKKAMASVDEPADAVKTKEQLKEMSRIQNRAEEHYQKVVDVKDAILERQREVMSEENLARIKSVFESTRQDALSSAERAMQKKVDIKQKLKAQGEDADALEAAADSESGLAEGRDERAQKEIGKAEAALAKAKERLMLEGEEDAAGLLGPAETALNEAKNAKEGGRPAVARLMAEELKELGNEVSEIARQLGQAKQDGSFEEVKEQLRQTIRSLHEVHMAEVIGKAPLQAREAIQAAMQVQEQKMEEKGSSGVQEQGKPEDKGPGEGDSAGAQDDDGSGIGEAEAGSEKNDESNSADGKDNSSKGKGTLDLQVSDAPADIGDFYSLEVTFYMARVFSNDSFEEIPVDDATVDLTKVIDDPESILVAELEEGTYNKIELHVSGVKGLLPDGDYVNGEQPTRTADVMVPGEKLQITKPFTITDGEKTEFVFDINVVRKGHGDEYNLLPVIAKSGVKGVDIED